jgi:hypothetical protein
MAAAVALFRVFVSGCSGGDQPRRDAAQKSPPVDIQSDERWVKVWARAVDEHDEVGQATPDRVKSACEAALKTMKEDGTYLMNVTDPVLRERLETGIPLMTDLYQNCADKAVVDEELGRRFLEVTSHVQPVGVRAGELGVDVGE